MAFLTMSTYSTTLHADTNVNVLLPENRKGAEQPLEPDRKYQVLYLLHGMGDDQTAWIRKSTIELVARERNVVVIMPTTGTGFYVNQAHGNRWYDWITKELPIKVANFFPVSTRREDTFVMGNSMGGYGALRIALANPDRYAGAASLSGALQPYEEHLTEEELAASPGGEPHMRQIRLNTFGTKEEYLASDNNLVNLAAKLQNYEGAKPKLFLCCGTEDPVTGRHNKEFRRKIAKFGLGYTFEEGHGGHNWTFWNPMIERAFDFLGIERAEKLAWT